MFLFLNICFIIGVVNEEILIFYYVFGFFYRDYFYLDFVFFFVDEYLEE